MSDAPFMRLLKNIYVYLVFPKFFYLSHAGRSINKEIHLKIFGTILGQSERDLTVLNKTQQHNKTLLFNYLRCKPLMSKRLLSPS